VVLGGVARLARGRPRPWCGAGLAVSCCCFAGGRRRSLPTSATTTHPPIPSTHPPPTAHRRPTGRAGRAQAGRPSAGHLAGAGPQPQPAAHRAQGSGAGGGGRLRRRGGRGPGRRAGGGGACLWAAGGVLHHVPAGWVARALGLLALLGGCGGVRPALRRRSSRPDLDSLQTGATCCPPGACGPARLGLCLSICIAPPASPTHRNPLTPCCRRRAAVRVAAAAGRRPAARRAAAAAAPTAPRQDRHVRATAPRLLFVCLPFPQRRRPRHAAPDQT
jgi:hypothetical protein